MRWEFDETLAAFDKSRAICREAAADCNKSKIAVALASGKTVAAVDKLAKADRRIAATIDQWDAGPWLLNTPDDVVDLRTGRTRAHRADDYMTKITAVGPRGDCPRFLAFLNRITGGDAALVSYLQRVLGYALTREHALFFAYGTGANGKSVLLSTVAGILGEYHRTAPIETFVASNGDRHPTDLGSAARVSSPQPKLRKAAAGPRLGSSNSPGATPSRRASCARTSSSTGQRSSSSSPATTSHRSDRSTRPSGGAST